MADSITLPPSYPATPTGAPADRPEVSVIVPALNEGLNIPLLVPRVHAAMGGRRYEVIIVDDNSKDDTQKVCAELAMRYPVRLLVRERPTNGLSGAVLAGMAEATGAVLLVMDADLQHPPESIPALLAPLADGGHDFALGSRYVPGGTTEGEWGLFRQANSLVATWLAAPFSGGTRDPMSGFFALRRETYERAERLTPLGYKIGLELMCKCRVKHVAEVPIHFGTRAMGESKLTLKQQFKYVEHLSRLYDYTFPRVSPFLKFTIAATSAWLVAAMAFWLFTRGGAVSPAWAVVLSYPLCIAATTVFHLRYVRTQWEFLKTRHPWRDFWIASAMEWAACAGAVAWAAWRLDGPRPWELFAIGYGAAMVARYAGRKELMLDLRGLRGEARLDELKSRAARDDSRRAA